MHACTHQAIHIDEMVSECVKAEIAAAAKLLVHEKFGDKSQDGPKYVDVMWCALQVSAGSPAQPGASRFSNDQRYTFVFSARVGRHPGCDPGAQRQNALCLQI